jgi:hypothetical protein
MYTRSKRFFDSQDRIIARLESAGRTRIEAMGFFLPSAKRFFHSQADGTDFSTSNIFVSFYVHIVLIDCTPMEGISAIEGRKFEFSCHVLEERCAIWKHVILAASIAFLLQHSIFCS